MVPATPAASELVRYDEVCRIPDSGKIDLGVHLSRRPPMPNVIDDADDLPPLGCQNPQSSPDRILPSPVALRSRAIDDRDRRAARGFILGWETPLGQPNTHRGEIARRRDAPVRSNRPFARVAFAAFDAKSAS